MQAANELISEVIQDLKGIAKKLNSGRVQGYLENAYRHRERIRERYRGAWTNEDDIDEFLQGLGYQNEEELLLKLDMFIIQQIQCSIQTEMM